jgi:hypothetical protein
MTSQQKTRLSGDQAGLKALCSATNRPTDNLKSQDCQIPPARRRRYVQTLHDLGPRVLEYFIDAIERGEDLHQTLEEYAALEPYADLIRAYGGAQFLEPFAIPEGQHD